MAVAGRAALDPRGRLAEGGGTESHAGRPERGVSDPVEPAFRESAVEGDVTGIRREAPALARNDHRLGVRLVLHGELRVALLDVGGGIGPVPTIGQEQRRRGHVSLELRVHAPLDGPAAGVERVGPVEAQQAGQIGEVALPGAGEDDEAVSPNAAPPARRRRSVISKRVTGIPLSPCPRGWWSWPCHTWSGSQSYLAVRSKSDRVVGEGGC